MSVETWMKQYAPEPERQPDSIEEAIELVRMRLIGVRPENLERHGVSFNGIWVRGNNKSAMVFGRIHRCPFCLFAEAISMETNIDICACCASQLGLRSTQEHACTATQEWWELTNDLNPEPALKALEERHGD